MVEMLGFEPRSCNKYLKQVNTVMIVVSYPAHCQQLSQSNACHPLPQATTNNFLRKGEKLFLV